MKRVYVIFLILVLSWPVIAPLFKPGFFSMHDDVQVARVFEMTKALKDGQFPVRFVADLGYGYGYPLFNFYAPLPYYFGSFLNLLGFSVLTAVKLMFLTGILLSAVFMYLLAREFWGELGGILAALLYLYAPYHALDIYVRGAVGEFWAMAFLPLVFLEIAKLRKTGSRNYAKFFWAGLAYAFLILSHNLTALIATPFLLAWIIFWATRSDRFFLVLGSWFLVLLFAFSLSAFYWLPAVIETKHIDTARLIIGEGGGYSSHFVFLNQLWDSPWGFAGSGPGRADGMSFKIGKLHLVSAFCSLVLCLLVKFRHYKTHRICGLFCNKSLVCIFLLPVGFLASVFMTLGQSRFVWQTLPFLPFLQYPWRFLTLTIFFISLLGGAVVYWISSFSEKSSILVAVFLGFSVLFYNAKYFQPQRFYPSQRDYTSFKALAWEASKLSDEYLPPGFKIPKSFAEVPKEKIVLEGGSGKITDQVIKTHFYSFKVSAEDFLTVKINTIYFPGFKAWINGEEVYLKKREDKLMEINLGPGENQVLIKLTNTKVRTFGDLLSLISFGVMGLSMLKLGYAKRVETKG